MDWDSLSKGFEAYLRLEKGLSKNSIDAYKHDVYRLKDYFTKDRSVKATSIQYPDLAEFVHYSARLTPNPRSRARLISGVKA
ncbi:MAG: site-specific integrase, partial [Cryomorphaceae bacterium]